MFRRHQALVAAPVLLAMSLVACNGSGGSPDPSTSASAGDGTASVPADAAAVVNGEAIPADVLERIVAGILPAPSDNPSASPSVDPAQQELDAQRQVLTQLIQGEVILGAGADAGAEVTEADVDEALSAEPEAAEQQREDLGLDEEEFARYVVRPSLMQTTLGEVLGEAVSPEDLQASFDELEASGQLEVATASHILVETQEEADAVLARLDDGEAFADVAADVSIDGSAQQGGALGEDTPIAGFVEPFANAIREATIGEVTGPVETQFGFHLIRVDDYTMQAMEDVEPQLRQQAVQAQVQETLTSAIAAADVAVSSRIGAWDPQTNSVVAPDAVGEAPSDVAGTPAPSGTAPSQAPTDQ